MKIAIGQFSQETDVFSPITTTQENFEIDKDTDIFDEYSKTNTELGGFISMLRSSDVGIQPILSAQSLPGGPVDESFYSEFVENFTTKIETESVDAVLLALHGAMVTEERYDPESDFIKLVRETVGGGTPIVVTFDHHGHPTRKTVEYSDGLVAYLTNPHVDLHETGTRAAQMAISIVTEKIDPTISMVNVPLTTPTREETNRYPMQEIFEFRQKLEVSYESAVGVFYLPVHSWIDVPNMGSTAIVVTDDDPATGEEIAGKLARKAWEHRGDFKETFPDVSDGVDSVINTDGRPIVISDRGDLTLIGAPGDSTVILEELLNREDTADLSVSIPIVDPEAVNALADKDGSTVSLDVGGKLTPTAFDPINVTGYVEGTYRDPYVIKGEHATGSTVDFGTRIVLQLKGQDIQLILSKKPSRTTSLEFYTSHGIDPEDQDVVVVKSGTHFRPAYKPIAEQIITVDSPGAASIDLANFDYKNARPIYPLDTPVPKFEPFSSQ